MTIDNIKNLIDEYNKEVSEILPFPKYTNPNNSGSIRVLGITPARNLKFKAETEIALALGVNAEDEILYTLDTNGIINVKKITDKMHLRPNEKFISAARIGKAETPSHLQTLQTTIPKDISRILKIKDKERLAWILDDNNNVIIKNTIFPDTCAINGEILDISFLAHNRSINIPPNIRNLLNINAEDVIVFVIKNGNIIIKPFKDIDINIDNLKYELTMVQTTGQIYLTKILKDFINPKDNHLLWILDTDGDIILRNTVLPNTCI